MSGRVEKECRGRESRGRRRGGKKKKRKKKTFSLSCTIALERAIVLLLDYTLVKEIDR